MLKKTHVTATLIFVVVLFSSLFLSGCSSFEFSPAPYTGKYKSLSQVANLPADYPTKYLPDGSVWRDFSSDMRIPVDTRNRAIQAQIRWWINNQGFLNRTLTRGGQYFYYIYKQAKVRNLPAELALLPVFESGYVPVNRSNKGAVGIWQFLPGTARNFGVRIDKWYDGRNDVVVSTTAAFKYLTYLYYFFGRDWLLAIAAYNTGEGNVQASVLRNKRRGYGTDFWSLRVHSETREYVPKLLALAEILRNPRKYGVEVVPINNGPYFEAVKIGQQISLTKAAKISGASDWTMRMLNAGYVRGITDPDGMAILLVPRSKSETFKERLSGRTVSLPGTASGSGFKSVATSPPPKATELPSVGTGETATSVMPTSTSSASTANVATAGTTASLPESKSFFASIFSPSSSPSSPSSTPSLPSSSSASSPSSSSNANVRATADALAMSAAVESEALSRNKEMPTAAKTAAAADEENTARGAVGVEDTRETRSHFNGAASRTVTHTVRAGETLFSIAQRYHMSAAALRRANNLRSSSLRTRQTIVIPRRTAANVIATNEQSNRSSDSSSGGSSNRVSGAVNKRGEEHAVGEVAGRAGLAKVAGITEGDRRAVDLDMAIESENLNAISRLQRSSIPNTTANSVAADSAIAVPSATSSGKHATSTTAGAASGEELALAAASSNAIPYRVARGDTVLSIAKKFRVTPQNVRAMNGLSRNSNSVHVGKILNIPHAQQGTQRVANADVPRAAPASSSPLQHASATTAAIGKSGAARNKSSPHHKGAFSSNKKPPEKRA